jgi:hypothetical protein
MIVQLFRRLFNSDFPSAKDSTFEKTEFGKRIIKSIKWSLRKDGFYWNQIRLSTCQKQVFLNHIPELTQNLNRKGWTLKVEFTTDGICLATIIIEKTKTNKLD